MKFLIVILGSNNTLPHSLRRVGLSKLDKNQFQRHGWSILSQLPAMREHTCLKVWPALIMISLCSPTIRYFLALCSKYRSSNKLSARAQKRRWWLILEVAGALGTHW